MAARRTRQISIKECYEILHLEKGADLQDVKSAYRRRAFELHPDLNPGNAEAGRQFQLLNEAYVALSAILKQKEETGQKAKKTSAGAPGAQAEKEAKAEKPKEETGKTAAKDASKASAAYAEQDVLRDLLNDPFARRVFEDIYSELNRKQTNTGAEAKTPPPPPPPPPKDKPEKKQQPQWEPKQVHPLPLATKEQGVKGAVKGWLRKQFDEEQTLTMPAARLRPGAKIRLQIRKGLSEDVSAVDVTLPVDFVVGKPMRLRGLGKRVGPWQGDLYLTIYTE